MRFDLQHDGASLCRRRKVGIVFDKVTITYRGATYEIGRGRDFYGIWTVGGPRSHPLEWWPETAEGWGGAWPDRPGRPPATPDCPRRRPGGRSYRPARRAVRVRGPGPGPGGPWPGRA